MESAPRPAPPPPDADWIHARLSGPPGRVHFVGIGGVGMAGVARHLAARGWRVTGSDLAAGRVTAWLAAFGVEIAHGHRPRLPGPVDWVVRTPAVPDDNPEIADARRRGIPLASRGQVLPALMRDRPSIAVCGTHGKTTTAAMTVYILRAAGLDPSYCIGGELDALGGVAAVGQGAWFVAEADESDGTLAQYRPEVTVLTNVEHDHMEHFPDEQAFLECFGAAVRGTRRLVVCCADDPGALAVAAQAPRRQTYGFAPAADVRGTDPEWSPTQSQFRLRAPGWAAPIPIRVPVPGRHNAVNALGAAAGALAVGAPPAAVAAGLAAFAPARRRFERIPCTPSVTVISDYAHHPTEIRAVLDTARRLGATRIRAVYQPHRFTRTLALMHDFPPAFEGLDDLILAPVYAASEPPIPGATSRDLLAAIRAHHRTRARLADSLHQAWQWLRDERKEGDLLLILGAGDVEQLAEWARRDLPPDMA